MAVHEIAEQNISGLQQLNPDAEIDKYTLLMRNVGDVIHRTSYLIFTLTIIPGLLSFKYFIMSLFFVNKSVLIIYVYFYIYYKYS